MTIGYTCCPPVPYGYGLDRVKLHRIHPRRFQFASQAVALCLKLNVIGEYLVLLVKSFSRCQFCCGVGNAYTASTTQLTPRNEHIVAECCYDLCGGLC